MSQLHLNQIRARLMERFLPHAAALRISDPAADEDRFLSRALAAIAIQKHADISEEDAAAAVVDDDKDGGLDALYFSPQSSTLYIVQSKWKNSTDGGIPLGDVLKYCDGIRNLLQSNAGHFGGPIAERWSALETALIELRRVEIILAYSSEVSLDQKQDGSLSGILDEFNQPTEVASRVIFSQKEIHSFLASGVEGDAIKETVRIFQWGYIENPQLAYYGQVAASDLVGLHNKYAQRLYSANIRQFLGNSGNANADIVRTGSERPDLFWYFNNGVTATADRLRKSAVGGGKRDVGDFDCEGLSIVNGAQTIGALSQIKGEKAENLQQVMVPIRIISLENSGDNFGLDVTKANNTQNRVDSRNFVALSPLHQRLRRDLLMDGVTYVIQQTDVDERGPKLFGVSEAFPAAACALDNVEAAVIAKREIGRLWDDLDSVLHRQMFPESTEAISIWKNVQMVRLVEAMLSTARNSVETSREKTVLAHGNRLAAHLMFVLFRQYGLSDDDDTLELSRRIAFFMGVIVADDYPNQYPAVIFKNTDMCKEIKSAVLGIVNVSIESDGLENVFVKHGHVPFKL